MNSFLLAEDALLHASRVQLDALEAILSRLDEDALKFDPDTAYREEIKSRLCAEPEPIKQAA